MKWEGTWQGRVGGKRGGEEEGGRNRGVYGRDGGPLTDVFPRRCTRAAPSCAAACTSSCSSGDAAVM